MEEIAAQEAELVVDDRQSRLGHHDAEHNAQPVEQVFGDRLYGVPFVTRFGYVERPCGGIVAPNAAIALKFVQPDEAFGCVTGKGNVLYPNIVAMLYHPQSLL